MSPLPGLMMVWLAAYLAAGAFYVLRGLGQAWPCWGEVGGLGAVALCWLPITVGNLAALLRTGELRALLARFRAETVPPLALLLSVVASAASL